MPVPRMLLRSGAIVLGAGGLVIAIVWFYLSMRTVMDIGGSCSSGGPYVTSAECPSGADPLTAAIFIGFACFFLYAMLGLPGPRLAVLAWPALFLSLGWNFIDYARHPVAEGSPSGSWWFCGVLSGSHHEDPFPAHRPRPAGYSVCSGLWPSVFSV